MTETAGVDFSTARPGPDVLVRAGFRFIAGYVSPIGSGPSTGPTAPNPKDLGAADLALYRNAGLAVVTVFESTAGRALSGRAGGQQDGAIAQARAAAIGYPPDCVIFAAVDFQPTQAQLPVVLDYLDGFTTNVGHPSGAYGSWLTVEYAAARRPGWWFWQTAAWSGGALSGHAHLYQRNVKHHPDVAGTDEDVLCAPLPWFGEGVTAVPPPAVPPAAAPHPTTIPTAILPAPALNVAAWRTQVGDVSVHVENLQRWGNGAYPLYCAIAPTDPHYGPLTAAFVREFAHRSGIPSADGQNIGPQIAAALARAGFRG